MIAAQKMQAKIEAQDAAVAMPEGLSDRVRVHFALRLVLGVTEPDAVGVLHFAASRLQEHAQILMREAFERGTG